MLTRQELNNRPQSLVFAMFDLLDLFLLQRGTPADDQTVTFRRIDGHASAKVIYFLPWHTPFRLARQVGFAPLDFLACYEMPPAIVSSRPELCVQAMRALVDDAEKVLRNRRLPVEDAIIVGLSVGTYPATYLANQLGARLCSVASADRADLAVWDSPATRIVKHRAMQQGVQLLHYSAALEGTHPAHNLAGVGKNSVFVIGKRDPFVPAARTAGLLRAIETHAPHAQVITLAAGHFKTLRSSGRYQRTLLGVPSARARWQLRVPTFTVASKQFAAQE
jgi:hypothetical protein